LGQPSEEDVDDAVRDAAHAFERLVATCALSGPWARDGITFERHRPGRSDRPDGGRQYMGTTGKALHDQSPDVYARPPPLRRRIFRRRSS